VELPVCETPAARSLAPLVHPTSTPSVVGGLAASTSSSLGNPYSNIFFACQAKLPTMRRCGVYMPSELWKFNDWTRWFCEIDKRVWTAHTHHPYTYEVAHVGCHARWRQPENFRKGLVCELGFGDEAYTILADLLPEEIYYPAWNKIKARVTPELLTGHIEFVYPQQNIAQGLPLPIVGRLPLERALAEYETGLKEEARRCLSSVLYLQECGDGGSGAAAWLEVVERVVAEVG